MTNKLHSLQNLLALSAATLIITVWATVSFLAYQNKLLKEYSKESVIRTGNNKLLLPTPTKYQPLDDSIKNWIIYTSDEYGFSFKYPKEMNLISPDDFGLELTTVPINCKTDVSGKLQNIDVRELKINMNTYSGTEFEETWRGIHGFQLQGNYDGQTTIGGKHAYYYYQGAESLYGRKAILVKIDSREALEINIYIPILAYDCVSPLKSQQELNNLADQILSTFEFTD